MNPHANLGRPMSGGDAAAIRFDEVYTRGYRWAVGRPLKDLVNLHDYFRDTRRGMTLRELYAPNVTLTICDKSMLITLLGSRGCYNAMDLSPMETVAFMEGAGEWLKERRRLLRRRKMNVDALLRLRPPPKGTRVASPTTWAEYMWRRQQRAMHAPQ